MVEKTVVINVTQKGTEKAIAQTDKLNSKLNNLKATTSEVTKGFQGSGNAILENGGAMGLLNDVTGGYAMTVKDAVEATGLFAKGTTIATTAQKLYTLVVGTTTGALKALRIALVATGIGAIVVAIGFLVSKIQEWQKETENQEDAQKKLNDELERYNKILEGNLKNVDYQKEAAILRAKIAGKSEKEIFELSQDYSKRTQDLLEKDLRKREKDEMFYSDVLKRAKKVGSEEAIKEAQDLYDKSVLAREKANNALLDSDRKANVEDLQETLSVTDKKRQAQKELLEKLSADREKDRIEEARKQKEFEDSLAKGLIDLQIATNEAEFAQRGINNEKKLSQADELAKNIAKLEEDALKEEEERRKKSLLFAEITEQSKLDLVTNTQNLLLSIFKKGSAIAKGIAIANVIRQQVESVSKIISSTAEANAKAVALSPLTAGQPFVAINTISAGVGIAASVAGALKAVKDITSESKSASGGNVSGGGGGSAPAPSFNLVQGTGSNQIAQGLATERQPVQAYVVASSVSTAQSLQRNIVENASL